MVHSISHGRTPRATPRAFAGAMAITGAGLVAALAAHAQPAARAARPDPLDPKAGVPMVSYESSFARYRRMGETQPIPWREANDAVARIGGWRAYAREAQQPDAAGAATPSQTPGPAATPSQTPGPAAKPSPPPAPAAKPIPHDGHHAPRRP
jgi:hypothetical protein